MLVFGYVGEDIDFCMRVLEKNGVGEDTCMLLQHVNCDSCINSLTTLILTLIAY